MTLIFAFDAFWTRTLSTSKVTHFSTNQRKQRPESVAVSTLPSESRVIVNVQQQSDPAHSTWGALRAATSVRAFPLTLNASEVLKVCFFVKPLTKAFSTVIQHTKLDKYSQFLGAFRLEKGPCVTTNIEFDISYLNAFSVTIFLG